MTGSGANTRKNEMLVLPATIFFLVLLSIVLLLAYRGTISVLVAQRQMEAETKARALALEFDGRALPRDDELALRRSPARAVALLAESGDPLVVSGEFMGAASARQENLSWWGALRTPPAETISGQAFFRSRGRRLMFQVDLPARALLGAARRLEILAPVVLAMSSALLLLVGFYLRRYLAPLERMLRRAQAAGQMPNESDELDFLLRSFEATLEKLATPHGDDLDTLERTLARSVESGLLLLDEAGRVLSLNEIGADLLEIPVPPPETPLGELLAAHPQPRDVLLEAIREQRGVERRELVLGDGEHGRTLGLTLHPLRRTDGQVRGFLAFFVDLTVVRRQAEERELAQSLARIGELSAGVAHEMRNSLATLRGYLTLIDRGGQEEDISEYVDEIRRETDHLKRVVDDFLTFARPGSTRMESVDLERLLHRAAADPALAAMPIRIDAAAGPFRVHGDAQLLERALRNLLHNAAEAERAAKGEGPLDVSLRVESQEVEVEIGDRGHGIPEEIRDRLFHPFVTQREGGVGLGLALTHRILELHGGKVRLADRPGGGTRALVRLRREEPGAKTDDASVTIGNNIEDIGLASKRL